MLGNKPKNPRVKVCLGRPNLEELIVALVDSTDHCRPMPRKLLEKAAEAEDKIYKKTPTARIADALERGMITYNPAEMFQMALDATEPVDGKPPESASLDGFTSMVRTVCSFPDETVTDEELASHLKAADTNGDGTFDEDEIAQVVETLRKQIAAQAQALIDEVQLDLEAQATPDQLQRNTSLSHASRQERKDMIDAWQIMYCGGAPPVVKTLEGVTEKYGIPLKIESFAW